eukprot:tig00000663_g2975.t1
MEGGDAEARPSSSTAVPILQLKKKYICVGCGKEDPELVEAMREGDMVCSACGAACPDRIIDEHSEWRTFANDDGGVDHNRVGAANNPLLQGGGLSTTIGKGAGSEQLQKLQSRNVSSQDKRMLDAIKSISKMADMIDLPQTARDRAAEIYFQVQKAGCCKGRPHEAVVATVIHIACRMENFARTFKEVCALTTLEKKDIGRCYRLVEQTLKRTGYLSDAAVGAFKAEDILPRWCSQLGIPEKQQRSLVRAADDLTRRAIDHGCVRGRGPATVATGALYMLAHLAGIKCPARELGEMAGLSESTVRQVYGDIWQPRMELVPDYFCPNRDSVDRLPKSLSL